MISVKIENKLHQKVAKLCSILRSFLLFGNIKRVTIGKAVKFNSNLFLGRNISIRSNTGLKGWGEIKIKNNVIIYQNVLISSYTEKHIWGGNIINRNCSIPIKLRLVSIVP